MGSIKKKISVIIPIYNVEEYLPECLESVINQSYSQLEVICVDDGSTDNSRKICEYYARRDSRITVMHQKNSGVSAARNKGLEVCTGEYISMIDGDDFLEKEMYEVLVDLIEKDESIGISSCGYYMDYGHSSQPVTNKKKVPEKMMNTRKFLNYIYIRDIYGGVASYLPTRLFKAEIFKKTSAGTIRFSEDLSIGEDIYLAAQCFLKVKNSIHTSLPYYHYRKRSDSAMNNWEARLEILGPCIAYEKIINLYKTAGIRCKTVLYVKRFYVYHASLLLELALKKGDIERVKKLKTGIRKYLLAYVSTNIKSPSRVVGLIKLLMK